ncbi:hypothetical protein BKA62DRAFT_712906 [Auriculariales sp. MPI-PUGE-AT-0066]|nr:hypothetical protein BKA62DRAFT_712906 [Auriculariales sp. MPI-PUGE-AT-0066]
MRFITTAAFIASFAAAVFGAAAPTSNTEFKDLITSSISELALGLNGTLASRAAPDSVCVGSCGADAILANPASACASATTTSEIQACICKDKNILSAIGTCVKRDCPDSSTLVAQLCPGVSGAGSRLTDGVAVPFLACSAFMALVL